MRKLLVYMKDYKKESFLAPLFKLLEATFELIVPLVIAQIIDVGIQTGDTGFIIYIRDSRTTVSSLNSELLFIILQALLSILPQRLPWALPPGCVTACSKKSTNSPSLFWTVWALPRC